MLEVVSSELSQARNEARAAYASPHAISRLSVAELTRGDGRPAHGCVGRCIAPVLAIDVDSQGVKLGRSDVAVSIEWVAETVDASEVVEVTIGEKA